MREIRFRAWDGSKMHYPETNYAYLLQWTRAGGWELWWKWGGEEKIITDNPLMQYTGLHDKNGKEIYEGDIVRLKWKDAGNHAKQTIRSVQWNGNGYGCALTEYECEVIGNVWENPELLGGAA